MLNLGVSLQALGFKVVVVSRTQPGGCGIRFLPSGIKVYYLPYPAIPLANGTITVPSFFAALPLFREICIRERVDIVHAHQVSSNLAVECLHHAQALGLPTALTDHSIHSLPLLSTAALSSVTAWAVAGVGAAVGVSAVAAENFLARYPHIPNLQNRTVVIPNGIDTALFRPAAPPPPVGGGGGVVVVAVARLTLRKGVDLLAAVVPAALRRYPAATAVVVGDGPHRAVVEEAVAAAGMWGRVTMTGAIPHAEVAAVLRRSHVALVLSRSEAFGLAAVEAAACGAVVVATAVGALPTLLPPCACVLAAPAADAILDAVDEAVRRIPTLDRAAVHAYVAERYAWPAVAAATAAAYARAAAVRPPPPLWRRVVAAARAGGGLITAVVAAAVVVVGWVIVAVLAWLRPAAAIDLAADVPRHTARRHTVTPG